MAARCNSLEIEWFGSKRALQSLVQDPAINRHGITWTTARRRLRTFPVQNIFLYPAENRGRR